jgi:cellulose synthase operon protein YhjQ
MTDRKALGDANETPEDVATLYSWANLHGAKYRDFSASRAQTREKARQRVQDAIESERRRVREEAEAEKIAEAKKAAHEAILAEAARKQEQALKEQAEKAAQQRAWTPSPASHPVSNHADQAVQSEYAYAPAATGQSAPAQAVVQRGNGNGAHAPAYAEPAGQPPYTYPASQAPYAQPVAAPREEPYRGREDHSLQVRNAWVPAETREAAARPAWLSERVDAPSQPVAPAPADTLQGSRDRLTSRWFALNGVFSGGAAPAEAIPAAVPQRAPVLAVFSLAGGVGKTSLVATLGRTLSARGERVLLVDTAAFGLLPFFFGARDQRPGVLRTFTAPGASGDAPVQMITVDPETLGPETAPQESLTQEISRHARGAGRVIVDLATASGATTRRVLRLLPTVLVPVVPDMSSVVSVSSIDAFFQHHAGASGQPIRPYYVLNQFDPSLPLHLDVREVLREQVGERLLPFALRRAAAVSEALAEGMTVVDYAPNSTVAEDFGSLAGWVKSLAAPASTGYRGVRWSER